jgi:hypothetical protein
MDWKFREYPILFANILKAAIGSAPGDKMNSRGHKQLESLYDLAISKVGGVTYFRPISFSMNFVMHSIS